ncbi:MAG: hypothetical protein AAGI38_17530 [Bacteroidota bacterium]
MKKLRAFFEKYKDYLMIDTILYGVMVVGILLYFALAFIFDWL